MKFIFIILYSIFSLTYCLHLTLNQQQLINKILQNPNVTPYQKEIIHKILYKSYEKLAVKKAYEFKKLHYYKCKDVFIDELSLYAKFGLWKSILKYKGYVSLDRFCAIYIKHELNEFLNDKYSLSILPKSIRAKSKKNMTDIDKEKYKSLLKIKNEEWRFQYEDLKLNNILFDEYFLEKWKIIEESLDMPTKIILYLKYDFYFNKRISNKEISEIVHFSEEYVRLKNKKFLTFFEKLYDNKLL
uniref:Sigma-70 region domain containing protein n=1 Tax=viral metagenome TaxID=1070528 RepID=A0A6C0JM47_9ZZZZ